MRIVILGGGVVGVTTAYQLQRDGHQVEILERNGLPAAGTSWGNAGIIAPGHAFAWGAPRSIFEELPARVFGDREARLTFAFEWRLFPWIWGRLRECSPARAKRNAELRFRLAAYSQRVLGEVVAREEIEFDRDTRGILYLYRSARALEAAVARCKRFETDTTHFETLDRRGILRTDPSLIGRVRPIAGAILRRCDETGDPAEFTRGLGRRIVERGGRIRTGVTVAAVTIEGERVTAVSTDHGLISADAYVLALGSGSAKFARRVGIELPIYPVKGYSLTARIGARARAPAFSTVDERNGVAITRFSDRLRVTAAAELAGHDTSHHPRDFAHMRRIVEGLYPVAADYEHAVMWAGLGPMTPTGLPIVARSWYQNFFVNSGHGHSGWTTSHGSARIAADLIGGRTPELSMEALDG